MKTAEDKLIIHHDSITAYNPGSKIAFLQATDNRRIVGEPDADTKPIVIEGIKDSPNVVPWGSTNKLPAELIEKVYALPQMTSNLFFNIVASYGDGIKPVTISYNDKKEKVIEPFSDSTKEKKGEVDTFFEENDIDGYLLEQLTDMHWFFNLFPEVVFNKETGEKRKIVEIRSLEAAFSRWSEMNKDSGKIEYHYYYAYWGDKEPDDDERKVIATPVLDFKNPVRELRKIMKEDNAKKWDKRRNSFIVPVTFPTPGRNYYQKPPWYSLIESGWYDFAIKIPEFKKAKMDNQIAIKYVVELGPNYFEEIFRREKITDDKKQLVRIKKEYTDIDKFLKGVDKAGKSIITFQKMDPKGQPYPMIKIEVINKEKEGGEYLEDSEEVSNIIANAMLTHPSIFAPSPGKNKTISGTEARELFIIKQAILKPFRDRILKPLYLIKAINNWPQDLHFVIPNLELTTLDKDKTGSVTKATE